MAPWCLPWASYAPVAALLLDRPHGLAGYANEGADLSLQLEPLGREAAMLKGVPVALWSAAASPVHPADVMSPHRWRLAL